MKDKFAAKLQALWSETGASKESLRPNADSLALELITCHAGKQLSSVQLLKLLNVDNTNEVNCFKRLVTTIGSREVRDAFIYKVLDCWREILQRHYDPHYDEPSVLAFIHLLSFAHLNWHISARNILSLLCANSINTNGQYTYTAIFLYNCTEEAREALYQLLDGLSGHLSCDVLEVYRRLIAEDTPLTAEQSIALINQLDSLVSIKQSKKLSCDSDIKLFFDLLAKMHMTLYSPPPTAADQLAIEQAIKTFVSSVATLTEGDCETFKDCSQRQSLGNQRFWALVLKQMGSSDIFSILNSNLVAPDDLFTSCDTSARELRIAELKKYILELPLADQTAAIKKILNDQANPLSLALLPARRLLWSRRTKTKKEWQSRLNHLQSSSHALMLRGGLTLEQHQAADRGAENFSVNSEPTEQTGLLANESSELSDSSRYRM